MDRRLLPRTLAALLLALAAANAHAREPDLAIVGATLVNPDSAPVADAVVLVRDGRIVQAGPRDAVEVPAGARREDATGRWLVPGYVDAHVHFFQSGGLYARPDGIDLREVVPYERETAAVRANIDDALRRTLRSGVTTAIDFGGPMWNFEVRERARGNDDAPEVAVAGPLVSTWKPPVLSDADDPPIIAAETPEHARELVRAQLDAKPDFVKIWFVVQQGESPDQHLPVVSAAIEEAHAHGMRAAVHATELETARAAVLAGADVLVHGVEDVPVDEAFVALLVERGVFYVPTLGVRQGYERVLFRKPALTDAEREWGSPGAIASFADLETLSPDVLPAWLAQARQLDLTPAIPDVGMRNLATVRDGGVAIAAGSDAGNVGTLHGASFLRELRLMADAGLAPAQVLADATIGGARLLGRDDALGTIAAGKQADLVVLDADPLADVGNLGRIHAVVKSGRWLAADAILADSSERPPQREPDAFGTSGPEDRPEAVVQRQLEAYNAGDIDAFLATYSAEIELFNLGGERTTQGLEAMRASYGALFRDNPDLHAAIDSRMVLGRYVIDHEVISGVARMPEGARLEAVAIYEVRGGRIRRVWFIH